MQSQTLTPFKLFAGPTRYMVPLFQRPYVWNREDQWEPLWEDVRTVAERLLESTAAGPFEAPNVSPHFLGAIVVDQQPVPVGFIDLRHIIDGQQRLTTLQLLLDAAQLVMQQHGRQQDAEALATLILNSKAIARSGDDVFKVWPTSHDQAAFRAAMSDHVQVSEELATSRIAEAHAYFTDAVTEWCEPTGDPDKAALRLAALARTLAHYLRVVVIDLEPGDNAQVIFETLNHRGTPLLAADLVKNLVFQRADQERLDVNDLYERHWRAFDSKLWRREIRQGRLHRPRIDVFLNYWLVMKRTREVQADRIFVDFRDYLAEPGRGVLDTVEELAASAGVYERLESAPWTSPEGTFAYRALSVLDAFAFGPFLLWLFGQPEMDVPPGQRRMALTAIESWLVRRMLCRLGTKAYNKLVVELLGLTRDGESSTVGDRVRAHLASQTADATRWPRDAEVVDNVLVQPLYTAITRARLRMVLEAIEDHCRTPKSEEQHCIRGRLTIEHVMPQGWREHWLLPPGSDEARATRRDRLVHTLGNLTLVNGRLNPALSNRPWTDQEATARVQARKGKRSLLGDHSVLMLNRQIVDGWPQSWSEEAIEVRGRQLAEAVVAIWARP
ncbi:MAG TPA: DUF262 domain-containing HNH endonuclease family protein [Actinomycetes bacterium]|nr:DUF262 domain-containing HNH endonuclease family protein [Actinomycetes bacterium]